LGFENVLTLIENTPLAPSREGNVSLLIFMFVCNYGFFGFENVLALMWNTPLAPLERGMYPCYYLSLFLIRGFWVLRCSYFDGEHTRSPSREGNASLLLFMFICNYGFLGFDSVIVLMENTPLAPL
jgi:hypothetical protein